MKKFILRTLSFIALLLIALCIKPIDAFAITPSELTAQNTTFICIHDESWSMQNTFYWESSQIEKALNNMTFCEHVTFGNNSLSNIWETLNNYQHKSDNIILSSDLWNTNSEDLKPANNKTLIIMVPYYSNFDDGVKHAEDVITNIILSAWTNSTVHVCYLDDEVISYSNVDEVTESEFDEPVSDEEVAEDIATSITEEVNIDESIPRDSVIVFDVSGSMSEFMNMLYNQLNEMTTTQKIETMYAFASYVSDEISPNDFNQEHLYDTSLGATSNIIGGIRTATKANPTSHIYLITDLLNNENYWDIDEEFSGLLTILEYQSEAIDEYEKEYVTDFYNEIKENYPNAESITRIKSN